MERLLSVEVKLKRGSLGEWNKRFAQVNSNQLWISMSQNWVFKDVYNLLEYTIHHFPDSQSISFQKKCGALENLNTLDSFTIRLKDHSNWFNHLQIFSSELQLQPDRSSQVHSKNAEGFRPNLEKEKYQNSLLSEFESDISRKETDELIENLFFRFPPFQQENFTAFSDEKTQESQIKKIINQVKWKLAYWKQTAILTNLVFYLFSILFSGWIEYSVTTITAILYFLSVSYCLLKGTNIILLSFQTPEIHAFTSVPIKAVYIVQIKSETDFTVKIYTNNLRFLPSMIDNIRNNYEQKKGIWAEEDSSSHCMPIVTPLDALLNIYLSILRNINLSEFKEIIQDLPFELVIIIILTFIYEFLIDFRNRGILFSFFNIALLKLLILLTVRSSRILISLAYKVQQLQTNYQKQNLYNYSINLINRSNLESLELLLDQKAEFNKLFTFIACVVTVFGLDFASVMCIPILKPYYSKFFEEMCKLTFLVISFGIFILHSPAYRKNQKIIPNIIECGICLEANLDGKQSTMFKCENGHVFHTNCITKWKESDSNNKNRQQCPVCRVSIISQSEPMTQ